jgi:Ferritin-like
MIWMKPEVVKRLDNTIEGLRSALQLAIKLEHATIPPYLYALYSLKPGTNTLVAQIVRSVVQEEMLHMSLACNVLNAVGGNPNIDTPDFVPNYPGPLPGSVESGLVVPLSPFSMGILENVFMVIEEPENPLEFPVKPHALTTAEGGAAPLTIGQFYELIKEQIIDLSKSGNIFTGDPALQLTTSFNSIPLNAVTDVDSAIAAITLIVDQGEGTTTSPLDPGNDPAHYYRYAEILYGFTLIANPDHSPGAPPFIYGGDPIPFDASMVWPVIVNPTSASYQPGSEAAIANQAFNKTYSDMLKTLHAVFNGTPDRIATAVLNMAALRQQAAHLMSIDIGGGVTAGPTFEFQAT